MTFSLATLVAIRRRMEALAAKPLLFHEVRTPARTAARVARIRRWLGPLGWAVTGDYLLQPAPRDARRTWGRHGRTA